MSLAAAARAAESEHAGGGDKPAQRIGGGLVALAHLAKVVEVGRGEPQGDAGAQNLAVHFCDESRPAIGVTCGAVSGELLRRERVADVVVLI